MEKEINKQEKIKIYADEKKGVYVLLLFYLISWGMIITPWGIMRLIGWVCMGLIGLALWKIFDYLFSRVERDDEDKKGKRRSRK